ncbi:MAG: hypothetical protein GY803_13460 [Chloroflexi bacterium]|nr:hypothetical protein [Chloroflexota bacterium]
MSNWVNVIVRTIDGRNTLLNNGTGSGAMDVFACSKFPNGSRPTKGVEYEIQAQDEDDIFPIEWRSTCTFSSETSEFKQQ